MSRHQSESTQDVPQHRSRGRPRYSSLLNILDGVPELGASYSSLQDQVTLYRTISKFPILNFVNEPMSHFVCSEVRLAVENLVDIIHHKCHVPTNIHLAHNGFSPFKSIVDEHQTPELSDEIELSSVTPCDGDGLVMNIDLADLADPLRNAIFTRLYGIDAPELSSVHFVKTNDLQHVFSKRMGHLSLCAVHLFLRIFAFTGSADLCEEKAKEGFDPFDYYERPLKEFWFRYRLPPTEEMEKNFLKFLDKLVSSESDLRKRLMSPFPASNATESNPFLLSLNALLVVTGFCHVFTKFSQDNLLLGLQKMAKENKMGQIWCGVSRNFIHGCNSDNNADFILKHFTLETTSNLERMGYPYKNSTAFLPWHERQTAKQICSSQTTRAQARDYLAQHLPQKEPQFGMYIEITRYRNIYKKYMFDN